MPKEPQDIFNQLANAIKSKKSERHKKDWNVLVKQGSLDHDPIGSSKEFEKVLQNRQSLRKSIKVRASHSSDDLLGMLCDIIH